MHWKTAALSTSSGWLSASCLQRFRDASWKFPLRSASLLYPPKDNGTPCCSSFESQGVFACESIRVSRDLAGFGVLVVFLHECDVSSDLLALYDLRAAAFISSSMCGHQRVFSREESIFSRHLLPFGPFLVRVFGSVPRSHYVQGLEYRDPDSVISWAYECGIIIMVLI